MSIYRNVHMSFWTDPKICEDFSPEDRYIFVYLLTNPHTTLCGCYEVSVKQIADETGYNTDTVVKLLKRLDAVHNVIRYSSRTRELLILNWFRYNWGPSCKLDKAILDGIKGIKNEDFREYLIDRYNERDTVEPYAVAGDLPSVNAPAPVSDDDPAPEDHPPEKKVKHKYGEHGWVKLTDEEYSRLLADLGETELKRCIDYIDESAQGNGNKNKWKDWNIIIRKCHRNKWGLESQTKNRAIRNDDYQQHGAPLSPMMRNAIQNALKEDLAGEGT